MKWVRLFISYIFCIVLFFSLIFLAFSVGDRATLANDNKVESLLNNSGFYSGLQKTITQQAQSAIANDIEGGSVISTSSIKSAAQTAFSTSVLQQAVHEFLTSNYSWLQGKTATPNFKIDLTSAKQAFADSVTQSVIQDHFNKLPACNAAQTSQLQSSNVLLLNCKPANVNEQTAAAQIKINIANDGGYLSNPVITPSTISTKGSSSGQLYYVKFSKAPKVYQSLTRLPVFFGAISLLALLIVLFASRTRRIGMRRITILLFAAGLLLIIDKFVSDFLFNHFKNQAFNGVNNQQIQSSLVVFAKSVESAIVKYDLWFGIVYVVIAPIAGIVLIRTKKSDQSKQPKMPMEARDQPPTRLQAEPAPDAEYDAPPRPTHTAHPRHHPGYKPTKVRKTPRPPKLIQ